MAKLHIPERYRAGVAKIRTLDDRTVQEIRAALDKPLALGSGDQSGVEAPPKPGEVAITALSSVRNTQSREFKQVAEALAALYGQKSVREVSVEEFVEDVCDAMELLPSEELRLPHAEREEFRQKLTALLSADVFSLLSKAYDLATEDERIYCHARILTDLRPIFGGNIEDGPRAMLVMHHLNLGFHHGSETKHQEFHVALDSDDLEALRKVIDRAEAKARSLKSALKGTRLFGIKKDQR